MTRQPDDPGCDAFLGTTNTGRTDVFTWVDGHIVDSEGRPLAVGEFIVSRKPLEPLRSEVGNAWLHWPALWSVAGAAFGLLIWWLT